MVVVVVVINSSSSSSIYLFTYVFLLKSDMQEIDMYLV